MIKYSDTVVAILAMPRPVRLDYLASHAIIQFLSIAMKISPINGIDKHFHTITSRNNPWLGEG